MRLRGFAAQALTNALRVAVSKLCDNPRNRVLASPQEGGFPPNDPFPVDRMIFLRRLSEAGLLVMMVAIGFWAGPRARDLYSCIFPEPTYTVGDYSAIYAEGGKSVVIFTSSTCPFCKQARALLSGERIDYRDYVIDQSSDSKLKYESLGVNGVPVLFIGGRRIIGYDEKSIRDSLALSGNAAVDSAVSH
jgi:mycoredoxin